MTKAPWPTSLPMQKLLKKAAANSPKIRRNSSGFSGYFQIP
jgi:hypothetical protein